ncbi:hypothetical protein GGTG_03851 [Gaeumannomyces tritici R3-111a-1]|uniref:Uncharacterized protein n=1 Tax=Gaeumannomyces tritici (strain R3-111a-1) TaxID=644352 RepID=J3NRE7_GAET3|nr:hypothetical protein GGTG_03851 [Gaeumannomyces tritici R3-111a-1]EJT78753.1 hypothetical protein GGTG_03851 [Gaeumannomyces tritici R3-111a-1]
MLHKSAIELAKKGPAEIWIASRNKVKGEEAVAEIQKLAEVDSSRPLVRFLELDLASFDSIKAAAQVLLASIDRIDILMLNAGILGGPVSTTAQGYEMQWGVNHVGHALLFKLLLLRLLETTERPGDDGDVRVISLSSIAHHVPVRGSIVWETLKSDEASLYPVQRYGQRRTSFTRPRWRGGTHSSHLFLVYPGIVGTDIFESDNAGVVLGLLHLYASVLGTTVEVGARTQIWAATAPKSELANGEYYTPGNMLGRIRSPSSRSLELGKKLWEWTEKELEGHGLG